ncbi:hypothetical protein FTX61_08630 [Nitriliruptoraceae bacterium ZYF776]|nr:hypothetical protein [Profundirhabdus halotolerans]
MRHGSTARGKPGARDVPRPGRGTGARYLAATVPWPGRSPAVTRVTRQDRRSPRPAGAVERADTTTPRPLGRGVAFAGVDLWHRSRSSGARRRRGREGFRGVGRDESPTGTRAVPG